MKRQMAILAGLLLTGSLLTACGTSAGNSQISSPDSSGQTVQETESPAKAQEETASGGQENTSEETTASEDQADAEGILSSFTATDLEGNEVDQSVLADYDLTVINVWATFCDPVSRKCRLWANWQMSIRIKAFRSSDLYQMCSMPTVL